MEREETDYTTIPEQRLYDQGESVRAVEEFQQRRIAEEYQLNPMNED